MYSSLSCGQAALTFCLPGAKSCSSSLMILLGTYLPSPGKRKNGEFSFVGGRVRQHVGYFIRRWLAWSLAHWVSKLQKLLSQQENLLVPDYRTRLFSSAEFRERMCMFNFCVNALPFIQCSYFIYAPQASLSLRPCDKKTRYSGNPRLEAAYWFLSTIE